MLEVTQSAIDAIKHVAPGDAGLRLFISGGGDAQALQVEVAEEPRPEDHVLEAHGAHVFLEAGAAAALDDMVLDAAREGDRVRFAVAHQH